jgi:Peptidase family C25
MNPYGFSVLRSLGRALIASFMSITTDAWATTVYVEYQGFGPKVIPVSVLSAVTGLGVDAIHTGVQNGRWAASARCGSLTLGWDEVLGMFRLVLPESAMFGHVAVVRLTDGAKSSNEAADREAGDWGGTVVPFRYRLVTETNAVLVPSNPPTRDGDAVFWRAMLPGHAVLDRLVCPEWMVSGGVDTAELVLEVAVPAEVGGRCRALVNGLDLGEVDWRGRGSQALRWRVPHGGVRTGGNRVEWVVSGERGSSIHADRAELWLEGFKWPTGTVEVEAMSDGILELPVKGEVPWIMESGPKGWAGRVRAGRREVAEGGVRLWWNVRRGERFWVVQPEGWEGPRGMRLSRGQKLYAGVRASVRVVLPDGWGDSARRIEEVLAQTGHRVRTHFLGEIRDGAGHGDGDPEALAQWLGTLVGMERGPETLVLIGDGHLDITGKLGSGPNPMPPRLETGPEGFWVGDTGLGDVDGDGWPEIVVCRVPVRTESECAAWLEKRERWMLGTEGWARGGRVLIAADGQDAAGDFERDGNDLASDLGTEWTVEKAMQSELGVAGVREALLSGMGGSADYVHYLGHGGRDRLGSGYLTVADLRNLPGVERAAVLVGMTCGIGQFAIPSTDGLGEALVRMPDGGAMAVWGATGTALSPAWRSLGKGWTAGLKSEAVHTLSDLIHASIDHHRAMGGDPGAVKHLVFLGDGLLPVPGGSVSHGIRLWVENEGGELVIGWTGGRGPFRLEHLMDPGSMTRAVAYEGYGRQVRYPIQSLEAGYFRVSGNPIPQTIQGLDLRGRAVRRD